MDIERRRELEEESDNDDLLQASLSTINLRHGYKRIRNEIDAEQSKYQLPRRL